MYKGVYKRNYKLFVPVCVAGAILGHLYARCLSPEPYTDKYITPYESEDQVHHILDTTKKPVVLYYYLPYML